MATPAHSTGAAPSGTAGGPPLGAVTGLASGWTALVAARRLGVLDRLAVAPASPTALADAVGLEPRLTAAVLDLLAAAGAAEVDADGAYHVAADTGAVVAWAERIYDALPDAWAQPDSGPRYDEPAGAEAHYPHLVGLLADSVAGVADELVAPLAAPGQRVLDVGAGAAPWSLAVLRREPTCQVTAVDLPEVLEVTRRAVADAGHADRYEFVGTDVFTHLPDGPYDLVLVGAVCHLFDEPTAARLIGRLAGVLAHGGQLAIIDGLADDPQTPPLNRAGYELGLVLRTGGGRLHTTAACRRWLADAGLAEVAVHSSANPKDGVRLHAVVGRRPA